jgi:hypothetical protein
VVGVASGVAGGLVGIALVGPGEGGASAAGVHAVIVAISTAVPTTMKRRRFI